LSRHIEHYDTDDYRIEGSKRSVVSSCPSCGGIHDIDFYGPEICKLCLEHTDVTRQEEIEASLVLADVLTNLESVGWSSFFGKRRKSPKKRMLNQVDLERKTTMWIVRIGGKAVGTSRRRVAD